MYRLKNFNLKISITGEMTFAIKNTYLPRRNEEKCAENNPLQLSLFKIFLQSTVGKKMSHPCLRNKIEKYTVKLRLREHRYSPDTPTPLHYFFLPWDPS